MTTLPPWFDALRLDDLQACEKVVLGQVRVLWKALHHDRPRTRPGPRPPDVYKETVAVLSPLLEALIPYGGLLGLKKLKPGYIVITPEGKMTVTAHALQTVKQWRTLRFTEDVVLKVHGLIGDNPTRAKRLRELQGQLSKLQQKARFAPHNRELQAQMREVQKQIKNIEDISLHYHEGTLRKPVRDAAIRFLLSRGVAWPEMPPCLVDKRQPWLGKVDRVRSFYDRQETVVNQRSDSAEEFEPRSSRKL